MPNGKGVAHELGRLSAGVKSAHLRLDGVNKRLDGMGKQLGTVERSTARIEGALELRPATVIPVAKNGTSPAPSPEASLSPEDLAALKEGRVWRGLGATLATARKNLLALLGIVLLVVIAYFQVRNVVRSGASKEELRAAVREAMSFVGPPAPRATP